MNILVRPHRQAMLMRPALDLWRMRWVFICVLFAYVNINASTHVESDNAIAIIFIYFSTQCDNKENCPPVEESWHPPKIDESLPTALKSTLVVLDKCIIPADAWRAVIALFVANERSESLNKVESAILKWLTLHPQGYCCCSIVKWRWVRFWCMVRQSRRSYESTLQWRQWPYKMAQGSRGASQNWVEDLFRFW